ncbi:type II toxin-antitoxin system HicA family toxin [Euhalothece natronophila Z-M001]|uniref:Type II toxin-antitoxin system HicA family toxin n=1 Tax=Euhalothece natronophila Z-M001 TaxID=522448 RepID=A0A5B8NP82_9CHRO|nr:type II toxin-antitoxin system HicA family toxin [Euhalothece natronophila]QDZ39999.1 type II toxin-antitoxin system HicA family toxin [Euhalothece natronophila Z-M001]
MKRRDLLRHLSQNGCQLLREGGSHSIWENTANKKRTSVPRHREIPNFTVLKICKQLEIPEP